MSNLEIISILSKLKNGLLKAKPELDDSYFGSNVQRERNFKEFYLWKYENNCFDNPGSIQLGTGTRAVKSSAAFIYNIFGNDDISINGIDYSRLRYEDKLQALVNRNPAHLDGCLIAKDNSEVKYFEAKLLEWSYSPKNLSLSYLDKKSYPKENEHYDIFIDFFNSITKSEIIVDKNGEKRRKHIATIYDVIQMTIHILGIYNKVCCDNTPTKIELVNLVWDYNCRRYNKEKEEAEKYVLKLNDRFKPLFEEKGKSFNVRYVPFSEFMNEWNVVFSNRDRKEYLVKRYMIKED